MKRLQIFKTHRSHLPAKLKRPFGTRKGFTKWEARRWLAQTEGKPLMSRKEG